MTFDLYSLVVGCLVGSTVTRVAQVVSDALIMEAALAGRRYHTVSGYGRRGGVRLATRRASCSNAIGSKYIS